MQSIAEVLQEKPSTIGLRFFYSLAVTDVQALKESFCYAHVRIIVAELLYMWVTGLV